jgi:hypothetical protein
MAWLFARMAAGFRIILLIGFTSPCKMPIPSQNVMPCMLPVQGTSAIRSLVAIDYESQNAPTYLELDGSRDCHRHSVRLRATATVCRQRQTGPGSRSRSSEPSQLCHHAIRTGLSNSTVMRDLGARIIQAPKLPPTIYNPSHQATDPRFGPEAALSAFEAQLYSRALFATNDHGLNNAYGGILPGKGHRFLSGASG